MSSKNYDDHPWGLNPEITFLNHGSFGATPQCVLQEQRRLRDALERDPIEFLAPERSLEPKLDRIRARIGETVNADAADIGFVKNATDGVNAVFRSMQVNPGDEFVITSHGYNACNNVVKFVADQFGAVVRVAELPFPIQSTQQVLDAVAQHLNPKTRTVLVDHVTSPTALVLPIKEIARLARKVDAEVMVDGAHAPGMIPVDLRDLDVDYYTANHHKWLCGPKASGFLWVRRELQSKVRPTIISHGANSSRPNRSRFLCEFDWQGTFDPTPILSMESAISFLSSLQPEGIQQHAAENRAMALQAQRLLLGRFDEFDETPANMLGSMASFCLPQTLFGQVSRSIRFTADPLSETSNRGADLLLRKPNGDPRFLPGIQPDRTLSAFGRRTGHRTKKAVMHGHHDFRISSTSTNRA